MFTFRPVILRWSLALLLALESTLSPAFGDELVPIGAFFSPAEIGDVRLSPSGKHLALTVPTKEGRMALAVVDTELAKPPIVIASDRRIDIHWFEWVNDDWLVFDLIDLQRGGGDQNFGAGLFSVRRDGTGARVLIHTGADTNSFNALGWNHSLLFVPRNRGTEVIVGEHYNNNLRELVNVTPKRLDVTTGRITGAEIGYPSNTTRWVFDRDGNARVAVASHNGIAEYFWRSEKQGEWRSLVRGSYFEVPWSPVAVDVANTLYVTRRTRESTSVLTRFDFKASAPESEPIAAAPGFDLEGTPLMLDGKVVGVRLETDAETTVWFDSHLKALQEVVDNRFPGRVNRISCGSCSEDTVVLVHSYSDRAPGDFWLFREKSKEWSLVGSARPAIDPRQMASLDLHRIKARDGGDLPVWVTTPAGKAPGPRPAVVLVHGGPWLRGTEWQWDSDTQFLASRGYVVIAPEFRGSLGFGFDHFRKGWKNWGTTMQDDVADAVRWAASQGIVDPKRICIGGGSYGGYATLMGAIRYPDLYRCGVAYVAVTDPRLMFDNSWQNDSNREMREFSTPILLGDPVKDAEMLKAAAPVERANEIRIPILMAFGRDDRRVPIEHGTRMRAAMRAAGHEPEYVVYDGEGHGWLKTENRIDFWTRVEKFLAKNLK